jgi:hypothetical protein
VAICMKRLLTVILLMVFASVSHAQNPYGRIMLYSDAEFSSCSLASDVGPRGVFVVHDFATGVTGSWFKVENVSATGLSYLAELSEFPLTQGTSQDGVAISYEGCLSGTILLLTITYWGSGGSPACSQLEVVGDPASPRGEIEITPCGGPILDHTGGVLVVRGNATCPCSITPVRTTTWGAVKSFYD